MKDALLDILEYQGEGYRPLIDFGTWRVAFLRYLDELYPPAIDSFERHLETDEVFVLVENRDTKTENSQYTAINAQQKACILEAAQKMPDWENIGAESCH